MRVDELFVMEGKCRPQSVIAGANYRFTVLTPQLVRMEYAPDGTFEDRPTQVVLNRDFAAPAFTVYETDSRLEIDTGYLGIEYDKKEFSAGGLSVKVRSECRGIYCTWHFSDPVLEGLWGTARSLDEADGAIPLEAGLQSRIGGFGVLDDSRSLILRDDGWVEPRRQDVQDIYFFGYGYAYTRCLHDFFHLCGKTPLLPRYALGNWWSRFYPYSDEEYGELMDRFVAEEIPLSVAVVDMDWHIKAIDPQYGKGWTGYTWNPTLFPQPKDFLTGLHTRNLKVTLNLHPAEGVQPHEAMYDTMCRALGRDPALKFAIHFDFCDPAFVKAYFQYLHHPQKRDGVDFWWIDWQQGSVSKWPDADPLWMLNHFHFLDSAKNKKRPVILSRYAGPGSHRYPIGFSGDSVISWDSLRFQPYFTTTAANIGYGWWSHDIGGHAGGIKDEELIVRWLQFGVFSPILRLHSTSNIFNGKEPWRFSESARGIMTRFLQLRHRLIPYIYSMNWRCYQEDEMLVQPMYYRYPQRDEAYGVPNQYEFGSELTVCPITSPMEPSLHLGCVTAWLPEGMYFDLFTGLRYQGGRSMNLYRAIGEIPVLAKAGAILPLTGEDEARQNGAALPRQMEIKVFGGADGKFELYEDDGESMDYRKGQYAITTFEFVWDVGNETLFEITVNPNQLPCMPKKRQYTIAFIGTTDTDNVEVTVGEIPIAYTKRYDNELNAIILALPVCDTGGPITVRFAGGLILADNAMQTRIFELLNTFKTSYEEKQRIYNCICHAGNPGTTVCELQTMNLPAPMLGAITEILFA